MMESQIDADVFAWTKRDRSNEARMFSRLKERLDQALKAGELREAKFLIQELESIELRSPSEDVRRECRELLKGEPDIRTGAVYELSPEEEGWLLRLRAMTA